MELFINTIKNNSKEIEISLAGEKNVVKKFKAEYRQAELLLKEIDGLLKKSGIGLDQIKRIRVVNKDGSFTALRIGVVTANALGYALGIPVEGTAGAARRDKAGFDVVEPVYEKEPNITVSKK